MALVRASLFSVSRSSCLKGTEIEHIGHQIAGVVLSEHRKMDKMIPSFCFVLRS